MSPWVQKCTSLSQTPIEQAFWSAFLSVPFFFLTGTLRWMLSPWSSSSSPCSASWPRQWCWSSRTKCPWPCCELPPYSGMSASETWFLQHTLHVLQWCSGWSSPASGSFRTTKHWSLLILWPSSSSPLPSSKISRRKSKIKSKLAHYFCYRAEIFQQSAGAALLWLTELCRAAIVLSGLPCARYSATCDCASRRKDGTPWAGLHQKQVETPECVGQPTHCRFLLKMDSKPYFLVRMMGRKR